MSCDRICFVYFDEMGGVLILMLKLFIMFSSFLMVFFVLLGMSGFVVELLVFFGIIISLKYFLMLKMLIIFVMVIGMILIFIYLLFMLC